MFEICRAVLIRRRADGDKLKQSVIDALGDVGRKFESSGFTGTLPTGLNRYLIAAGIAIVALAIVVLVSRLFLGFGLGGLSTEEKTYAKMGRLGLIARVRPRPYQTPWEYEATWQQTSETAKV